MSRVVIAGCGFLGEAAADLFFERGWEVLGICARPQSRLSLASKSYEVRALDIAKPFFIDPLWRDIDALVHCAGPDRAIPEAYQLVYVEGLKNALAASNRGKFSLREAHPSTPKSTDRGWMKLSETQPDRETSRILLEAEAIALKSGGFVARLSGLYGPGRSVLMRKFLAGEAIIEGEGTRWINQIHRDDAAQALVHLLDRPVAPGIYNVTDSTPARQIEVYSWLADYFHRPLPPHGPPNFQRTRGWTNKRVSNAKLRETDWRPAFPAYRDAIPLLNGK